MYSQKTKLLTIASLLLILASVSFAMPIIESISGTISPIQMTSNVSSEIIPNALASIQTSALPVHSDENNSVFENFIFTPNDTSNNPLKQVSSSDVSSDDNGVEKKPVAFESPLASFFDTNISNNINEVGPLGDNSDDSCSSTSSNQLGTYYYKSYIDSSGDVDWYSGSKAQSFLLRVVMIPPVGKDYDIEIWDSCSSFVTRCNASSGSTEVCNASVSGDFYVKVYGYNSAYSSNAPYFIVAGYNAACTVSGINGNPTKSSYACNETVQAQNQRFTNNNSSTISYHYFESLHYPSNNFAAEGQTLSNSLSSNTTANWTTGGYTPLNSGWSESGNYTIKSAFMAFCSNGGISSANAFANPNVPTAPCPIPGTINGYDGTSTKSSYACSENIVTENHRFENTSNTYTFNYTLYYELRDPNNNVIASANKPDRSLSPNSSVNSTFTFTPGSSGWPKSGTYTVKSWADGTFTDGRNKIAYSYAYPYVPTGPCPKCDIAFDDGNPTKSSFKSYETTGTENHNLTNSGDLKFTYDVYSQLFDPSGNEVSNGTFSNNTLDSGYYFPWGINATSPTGGWEKTGTYTRKLTATGTCSDGTPKTLYSYAYPIVDPTCHMTSSTAWVSQQNLCSEKIITKHEFINNGTRTLPYNANFYLYDPNGNQVQAKSNSYSATAHTLNTWTVPWDVPSGGWKAGTYRAEAQLSGNCIGGGSSLASNSTNPSMPTSCNITTCGGRINVSVKDISSNGISGAKVYLDGSYRADTDSSGSNSQSTSDVSCGQSHSVAIYCSNGIYCDTKSTTINSDGDEDPLNFTCQVCVPNKNLSISASSNSSYSLNDSISLDITVQDGSGVLIDGATLTIYDPFLGYNVTRTTVNGRYTYNTTATKTGTKTFTINAGKSTYTSASTTKSIAVGQNLATVVVNAKNTDSSPLSGAIVYADGVLEGETSSAGKRNVNITTGNHRFDLKCPDTTFCSSASGSFHEGINNLDFSCNCDIDADGDGFTNSKERLIGSDIRSPLSTPPTVILQYSLTNACLNPVSINLSVSSEEQKQKLVQNLKGMNYAQLSAMSLHEDNLENALHNTGISVQEVKVRTMSIKELVSQNEDIEGFMTDDNTMVIIFSDSAGNLNVTQYASNCQGLFIGLASGGVAGLKDDATFVMNVIKGIIWAAQNYKEVPGVISQTWEYIRSTDFSALLGQVGNATEEATFDILKEGTKWNNYNQETPNYAAFQTGFLQGFVSGYVIEQVFLLKGVGNVIKSIKVVKQTTKLIGDAYKAFSRIFDKFGSATAMILSDFKVKIFEKWTISTAQDFAASLPKLFAKTSDADNWLYALGSRAEEVAAKGERVMQNLISQLGAESADRAMSKLLNSEFGRKALAEWASEDAVKYYAKMYEKYGTGSVERLATKFSSHEVEPIMKNLNELKPLNLIGFDKWEEEVILRARSGINYEVAVSKVFKDKGYQLLEVNRKLGQGGSIGQIDSIFRANGKKVAAEIKEGIDDATYASDIERLQKQLKTYNEFAASQGIDEIWLVYRDTIPQAYKDYAEGLGVKVYRAGALP